jgi:hypothetical protein
VTGFALRARAAVSINSFSTSASGIFMLAVLRSSGAFGGLPRMP